MKNNIINLLNEINIYLTTRLTKTNIDYLYKLSKTKNITVITSDGMSDVNLYRDCHCNGQ